MYAAAPRYTTTLDLPIWTPEERPIWTYSNLTSRVQPDEGYDTFIRAVGILTSGVIIPGGLKELLKRTDHELNEVARFCGTTVVGHTWGLYEMSETDMQRRLRKWTYQYSDFKIPPNHVLAAEVDYLYDAQPVVDNDKLFGSRRERKINRAVGRYKARSSGLFLSDMSARQHIVQEPDTKAEKITLVDIEPLFKFKS